MQSYQAPRAMLLEQMLLDAPPTEVFPLLCPVREHEWVEGWDCQPIYLSSGLAEEDGVFKTAFAEDGPEETWVITRYRPPQEIEFVRVNAWRVIRYHIGLRPEGQGQTRALWRQLVTATSEEGRAWLERHGEAAYRARMELVAQMLNRYLRTGQRVGAPGR